MATEIPADYTDTGISIYLYVNKATSKVEAILAYHLFGMSIRKDGQWEPTTREDSNLLNYINSGNYKTYVVDWDKEPITDADPNDPQAWEHQLVQLWDNNVEIDESDITKYAHEINTDGVDTQPVPEDTTNEG